MAKTSILLLAGAALAGAAAFVIARRKKNLSKTTLLDPVKKSRHLNPVFSHMKQDISHS